MDVYPGRSTLSPLLDSGGSGFGDADAGSIRRSFVASARRFRGAILHLVDDLAAGSIDLPQFTRRSRRVLRDELGIAYTLGALSVDSFHTITIRDLQQINREISEEAKFLRAFGRDLQRGFYVLDPAQRAGLYLQSLRGMFELGRSEAAPPGPYEWVLGPTEHCLPCLRVSISGPYQRDNLSLLGLPSLPGIPGSGDVCSGLTRCGCVVRMATGFPLPNEELQSQLREILVEVLHD